MKTAEMGPESLAQVKDRIAQQVVVEYLETPEGERGKVYANSLQRMIDLFIQNGLENGRFLNDVSETLSRTQNALDAVDVIEALRKVKFSLN